MIALARPEVPNVALPADRGGIPVWHLVISGFTQTLRQPSGCQYLWDAMRRSKRPGVNSACMLYPWNADWRGVAELVWRFRPCDRPPRVFCYAYSWGGGWGFPRLSAELGERDIEVTHAVLCDAVFRPHCRALAFLALTPGRKILVPANVREVTWFRQRTGLPMGHDVVAADPKQTRVHPGILVPGVTHHYMDDEWCWWNKCLQLAGDASPAPPYGSLLSVLDAA